MKGSGIGDDPGFRTNHGPVSGNGGQDPARSGFYQTRWLTPNGDWTPQTEAIKLSQAEPGKYRVVRVADTDPEQLSRLQRAHVTPVSTIQVQARLAACLLGDRSPAAIEPGDLDAVRVRPA